MKTKRQLLIKEIDHVSKRILDEVIDFVIFLKTKSRKSSLDLAIASESSLKKDWLTPEEEQAWQNL